MFGLDLLKNPSAISAPFFIGGSLWLLLGGPGKIDVLPFMPTRMEAISVRPDLPQQIRLFAPTIGEGGVPSGGDLHLFGVIVTHRQKAALVGEGPQNPQWVKLGDAFGSASLEAVEPGAATFRLTSGQEVELRVFPSPGE